MPRNAGTGVFTRVSNSFSNPVFGTLIDPTDADALFDDQDVGLNPPQLAGPVAVIGALSASTTMTALTYNKVTITAPATSATLTLIDGTVITGPAATDTLVGRASTDTFTGVKTFGSAGAVGRLKIAGTTSGTTILDATAIASGTLTLPAVTDTIVCRSTVDTLTGKTFDTAGVSNSFLINGVAVTANSGTGAVVRASSPTLTTPVISTITNTGTLTLPTSTDTLVGKATTDTFTNKTFNSTGTGNVLQVSGITVSAGQYPGEPTTGSATAGNVGEYIEAILASGSATSLVTATPKTITSISLTAGDWDVDCTIYFIPAASTNVTRLNANLSLTTNTATTSPGAFVQNPMAAVVSGGPALTVTVAPYRFSLSGTTSIFLVADQVFTASTMTGFGIIRARRVR